MKFLWLLTALPYVKADDRKHWSDKVMVKGKTRTAVDDLLPKKIMPKRLRVVAFGTQGCGYVEPLSMVTVKNARSPLRTKELLVSDITREDVKY